jgi:putative glutamine amidotransferase
MRILYQKQDMEGSMYLIGLSANWNDDLHRSDVHNDCVTAVIAAGAVPMIMPLVDSVKAWKSMVDKMDAIIFTGGDDVNPKLYGEEPHAKTDPANNLRDRQEAWMINYATQCAKPFLCICRGLQLLNVIRGGSLYQDIQDQYKTDINHAQFSRTSDIIHTVSILESTNLRHIIGSGTLGVNSRHHQAIKEIAPGFHAAALSPDGIVEAIEPDDSFPCMALQWHPESLYEKDPRQFAVFEWLLDSIQSK